MQTSPLQYLLKYRVTQGASMLLRSPHSSISSIAGMCGFNRPSNFSQMFVRFFK
ncbi:MAG: helix-turn-helix domain-containing protein [Dialister invisus]